MNERINELIGQAKFMAEETINKQISKNAELDVFAEKFAELIVRECANILDPNSEFTEKYKTAHTPGPDGLRTPLSPEQYFGMLAAEKLKENFGVE